MAIVNITPQSWQTSKSNMNINITGSSIAWGTPSNDVVGYAKAYVSIDTSKYKSVTLNYDNGNHTVRAA